MYAQIPEAQAIFLALIAVFIAYAWHKTSHKQIS